MDKPLTIYGTVLQSRLILGSALYPSLRLMIESLRQSGCEAVTLSCPPPSP